MEIVLISEAFMTVYIPFKSAQKTTFTQQNLSKQEANKIMGFKKNVYFYKSKKTAA